MPRFTPATKWIAGVVIAGLLTSAMAGCGEHAPTGDASAIKDPPVVTVAHPQRQTLERPVEQPARVEAFEQTPIYVKIPGYADKVEVEIGTAVKKGDPLAELRVPELLEDLKYKTGLVEQARIDITLADKALLVAQANVKTAEALIQEARSGLTRADTSYKRWKTEAARMGKLVKGDVISVESGVDAAYQFEVAQAARAEADAKVQSAEAGFVESQARRDKAETDVAAARNRQVLAETDKRRTLAMLEYTHVTAPFDGVVSERHVDTGHFLQPTTGSSTATQPLFVVVRTDKVRVFLEVPETDAVLVKCGPKEGSQAIIRVPVLNDREFTGRVAGSSWSLAAGQRTLRTEIDFDNTEGVLRPGMYAHALIEVQQPDAWTLPSAALATRDGQTFCYCLEDGKAVWTPVKVGSRQGGIVEVVKKQVQPAKPGDGFRWVNFSGSESVITDRVKELINGQPVRVSSTETRPAG
jgi:HlyD family secretion protein